MREWLKRKPLPAAADDAPAARFLYRQHVGDVRLPAVDTADIPERQIQTLQITKGRLKTEIRFQTAFPFPSTADYQISDLIFRFRLGCSDSLNSGSLPILSLAE